jgi:hypothetical protein
VHSTEDGRLLRTLVGKDEFKIATSDFMWRARSSTCCRSAAVDTDVVVHNVLMDITAADRVWCIEDEQLAKQVAFRDDEKESAERLLQHEAREDILHPAPEAEELCRQAALQPRAEDDTDLREGEDGAGVHRRGATGRREELLPGVAAARALGGHGVPVLLRRVHGRRQQAGRHHAPHQERG